MCFLSNLCFLCLSDDQKLISQRNLCPSILEIFGYILPEYAFQVPNIPNLCDNCLNNLEDISNFRQKCLASIRTYKKYVPNLKQGDESSMHISTDISDNQKYEIFEDIQNAIKIKTETCLEEEMNIEKPETDYPNAETGNNEQILGNFELVDIRVKKEIDGESIIEEDSYLLKNEILSSSEFHNIKNEKNEKEDGSSNESIAIDSQSAQPDTDPTEENDSIDTNDEPNKCDICQKTFKNPAYMKRHIRMHTNDRPYTCEICQKSFRQSSTLKTHKRTHTNEKPHTCEICQRSFKELFSLRRHNLIHTGNKPFVCEVCQISFTDVSAIRKHNLIHTGEKPFSCEICHKTFALASQLKSHSRVHTSAKPYYFCSVCQKSFGSVLAMNCHIGCPSNSS